MRLGSVERRKQYDQERVGCGEAMESGSSLRGKSFLFVSTGVRTRERGTYVEEKRCKPQWLEG